MGQKPTELILALGWLPSHCSICYIFLRLKLGVQWATGVNRPEPIFLRFLKKQELVLLFRRDTVGRTKTLQEQKQRKHMILRRQRIRKKKKIWLSLYVFCFFNRGRMQTIRHFFWWFGCGAEVWHRGVYRRATDDERWHCDLARR